MTARAFAAAATARAVAAVTARAFAAVILVASLGTGVTAASAFAASAGGQIPPPVHVGTLRISGVPRDGSVVTATGLTWHAPRLPHGMSLLSFEVGYTWQSCAAGGQHCTA